MNINRFQIALQHEEPDMVRKGLDQFQEQILIDYNALGSFGYNGRPCKNERECQEEEEEVNMINMNVKEILYPLNGIKTSEDNLNDGMNGLLKEYLSTSPNLEELFGLFFVFGRDEDHKLSASHTSCIAKIIHCLSTNAKSNNISYTIVNRLLHENSKTIQKQLVSGNTGLIHATIGLLIAMCRVSIQCCRDVCQKIIIPFSSSFNTIIQKGKTVQFVHKINSEKEIKIITDARMLIIILIFVIVDRNNDPNIINDLLSQSGSSLLKKVTHSINKDNLSTVKLILNSILFIVNQSLESNQTNVMLQFIHNIIDTVAIQKLLSYFTESNSTEINDSTDENYSIRIVINKFLLTFSDSISQLLLMNKRLGSGQITGNVNVSLNSCASQLIKVLEAHKIIEHKEIQMILLHGNPSLLIKCVNSFPINNWDPKNSLEYRTILSHLCYLLETVEVDWKQKDSMRNVIKSNNSNYVEDLFHSMIPAAFSKKDFCKLLSHNNLELLRLGLLYYNSILKRIRKIFNESGISKNLFISNTSINHQFNKFLPDFQFITNVWLRISKQSSFRENDTNNNPNEKKEISDLKIVQEEIFVDFEFNFADADDAEPSKNLSEIINNENQKKELKEDIILETTKGKNLFDFILLDIIDNYIYILPSEAMNSSFDFMKLIDDYVLWDEEEANNTSTVEDEEYLLLIVKILKQFIKIGSFNWFGTLEDCVKTFTNILTNNDDYKVSLRRVPFIKLLQLSQLYKEFNSLNNKLMGLVRSILMNTGLFNGHDLVDIELNGEMNSWMKQIDIDATLVGILILLSFHYNTELSMEIHAIWQRCQKTCNLSYYSSFYNEKCGVLFDNSTSSEIVPFSPILYCANCLVANKFDVFKTILPKYIRSHIENDNNQFFEKYNKKFNEDIFRVISCIILDSAVQSRNAASYLKIIQLTLHKSDELRDYLQIVSTIFGENVVDSRLSHCKESLSKADVNNIILKFKDVFDSYDFLYFGDNNKKKSKISKSENSSSVQVNDVVVFRFIVVEFDAILKMLHVGISSADDFTIHSNIQSYFLKYWKAIFVLYLSEEKITGEMLDRVSLIWLNEIQNVDSQANNKASFFISSLEIVRYISLFLKKRNPHNCLKYSDGTILLSSEESDSIFSKLVALANLMIVNTISLLKILDTKLILEYLMFSKTISSEVFCDSLLGFVTRILLTSLAKEFSKRICNNSSSMLSNVWKNLQVLWDNFSFDLEYFIASDPNSLIRDSTMKDIVIELQFFLNKSSLQKLLVDSNILSFDNSIFDGSPSPLVHLKLAPISNSNKYLLLNCSYDQLQHTFSKEKMKYWKLFDVNNNSSRLLGFTVIQIDSSSVKYYFDSLSIQNSFLNDTHLLIKAYPLRYFHSRNDMSQNKVVACQMFLIYIPIPLNFDVIASGKHDVEFINTCLDQKWVTLNSNLHSIDAEAIDLFIENLVNNLSTTKSENNATFVITLILLKDCLRCNTSYWFNYVINYLSIFSKLDENYTVRLLKYSNYCSIPLFKINSYLSTNNQFDLSKLMESFFDCYCELLSSYISTLVDFVTIHSKSAEAFSDANMFILHSLLDRLQSLISLTLERRDALFGYFNGSENSKISAKLLLPKKLNKLIKVLLKNCMTSDRVLLFLKDLIIALNFNSVTLDSPLLLRCFTGDKIEEKEVYHPLTLFKLTIGHSKFTEILNKSEYNTKYNLIYLLLEIATTIYHSSSKSASFTSTPKEYSDLSYCLVALYSGTMSFFDRLLLRLLSVLSKLKFGPDLATIQLSHDVSINSESSLYNLSNSLINNTIIKFPVWRTIDPQPLYSESRMSHKVFVDERRITLNELNNGFDEDEDSSKQPYLVDYMIEDLEKIYDISYILPVIFHHLRCKDLLIRHLANNGILALLIISLSSFCPIVRSYALASLQRVYKLLYIQTANIDPLFKERPQLITLLKYIRDSSQPDNNDLFSLNPTMAIFLAKSSIILMQSNNELYSKMNKYLLSRPFCDSKDIPLYDIIILNSDIEINNIERLLTLRLLRDGLTTKEDHANLCRKNFYNRLVLLFPLLSKDHKSGHIILDIIDKGLSMKISSRYLLDRCSILSWVKTMMGTVLSFDADLSLKTDDHNNNNDSPIIRYNIRYLNLIRKIIGSSYLLASECESEKYINQLETVMVSIVKEFLKFTSKINLKILSDEFFKQLILCIWDIAIVIKQWNSTHQLKSLLNSQLLLELLSYFTKDNSSNKHYVVSIAFLFSFDDNDSQLISLNKVENFREIVQIIIDTIISMLLEKVLRYNTNSKAVNTETYLLRDCKIDTISRNDNTTKSSGCYECISSYVAKIMKKINKGDPTLPSRQLEKVFELCWDYYSVKDINNNTFLPSELSNDFLIYSFAKISLKLMPFIISNDGLVETSTSINFLRSGLSLYTSTLKDVIIDKELTNDYIICENDIINDLMNSFENFQYSNSSRPHQFLTIFRLALIMMFITINSKFIIPSSNETFRNEVLKMFTEILNSLFDVEHDKQYYCQNENITTILSSKYYKQLEVAVINSEETIVSPSRGTLNNIFLNELTIVLMNFLSLIMTGYDRYGCSSSDSFINSDDFRQYENIRQLHSSIINNLALNIWTKNNEMVESFETRNSYIDSNVLFSTSCSTFEAVKKQISPKIFRLMTPVHNAYNFSRKNFLQSRNVSMTLSDNSGQFVVSLHQAVVVPKAIIGEEEEKEEEEEEEEEGKSQSKKRVRNSSNNNSSSYIDTSSPIKGRKKLRSLQLSFQY